ncbi:hypothetical protein AURDEDRAFT_154288 [Auricularia subglabra TFB-10046 SS5]|uniref:JmjC domain-containing protein n=1 Tax=Auricularia subglabra (strain TFB-10046 / SS5) TaxID=717982 RepID=J0LHU8_AURST|nr:hypothetical protein AURDEDRAFT_154288 [Auricularia subglabra TFB-10046 SS5]
MVNIPNQPVVRTENGTRYRLGATPHDTHNLKFSCSRLASFASDWSRLSHTNSRFADGCALLNKLNPRNRPNIIEVNAHNDGIAPTSSIVNLINTEIDNLDPERCVCSPLPDGSAPTVRQVHDSLDRGNPLVVGVHAPLADGLGALPAPQLSSLVSGPARALVLGAGAVTRTVTPSRTPVITQQILGQALLVFWPESRANRDALRGASGEKHVISRLDRLDGLRVVVLHAGETHVLPAGARYLTLALGYGGASFAVQMKYSTLPPTEERTAAITGKRSFNALEEDNVEKQFKRVKIEDM